ncbi:hypothetical protein EZV62_014740 [Acer yangbiense]|uniref:Uncharacterized protein n=1 Tax=Acer yangbiense TaxID=1000413 RepID=A0A5C7HSV3_9ROSI|nr:hypothetical protein EZV62_014740 [Acer yangbiense]
MCDRETSQRSRLDRGRMLILIPFDQVIGKWLKSHLCLPKDLRQANSNPSLEMVSPDDWFQKDFIELSFLSTGRQNRDLKQIRCEAQWGSKQKWHPFLQPHQRAPIKWFMEPLSYVDAPITNSSNISCSTDSLAILTPEREGIPIGPWEALKDPMRIDYHYRHLWFLQRAIKDGVNVKSYFAWSLLDNMEWNSGYTVRFGIYFIDYVRRWLKKISQAFCSLVQEFPTKAPTSLGQYYVIQIY